MLPRPAVARSSAFVVRRIAVTRPTRLPARFQSTSSSSSYSSTFDASHVAAGVAGGLTVALIGYVWYHTSSLKTVVQASKEMKKYLQSTRDTFLSKANETLKNPRAALPNLRGIAKSYTVYIPGGEGVVDGIFDELTYLYEMNVDEMDLILKETTEELIRATQNRRGDAETAKSVYDILGNGIRRMKELGKKAGGDFLDRNPMIKEKLGDSYEQLKNLAQKAGPEGKMALKEVKDRVKELVSKGKLDEGSIKKVQDFIQEKTNRLKRNVGESEVLEELSRNVPDADEIFKKAPHAKELVNLARDRGEEAKNLVKETVSDVMAVLEEKGKKARELSERAKDDAEKRAKN